MKDMTKGCSKHRGRWMKKSCNACHRLYMRQRRAINGFRYTIGQRYANARYGANRRGYVFELTLDEFDEIVSRPCAYSSSEVVSGINIGVDRKDNTVGYAYDNCVACCARHNEIKRDVFTYEEMQHIVKTCVSARSCGNAKAGRQRLSLGTSRSLTDAEVNAMAAGAL